MTRNEFAKLISGRQYREEMSREECKLAKESGLLVVFGASDDLTEFRGVMNDEAGAYRGATHIISDKLKLMELHEDHDALIEAGWIPPKGILAIEAKWCPDNFEGSWLIETDVPHSTFDIMDDGELYCRGIVIAMSELA